VDTYQIYDGTDENGIVGTVARAIRSGGSVLAHDLCEPSRPWNALHATRGMGGAVEVLEGLDQGLELRPARRRVVFRKLTEDSVVWDRWDRSWRARAESDGPGRSLG
jgi:hypothetical protein